MQKDLARQFGDLLASWLAKSGGAEAAKEVAAEIGYNDAPLFGAAKKKMRLISELVSIHAAIAIFCVNQVFDHANAKAVIDAFLAISNKSIFSWIESKDAGFSKTYEARMAEYFKILHGDKAPLGLSFSLMQHLGKDPLKDMKGQVALAARLAGATKSTLAVLDVMKRRSG